MCCSICWMMVMQSSLPCLDFDWGWGAGSRVQRLVDQPAEISRII